MERRLNAGRKWHVEERERKREGERREQEVERRRPGPYARFSSRVDKGDRNRAAFWVKYIHGDCYVPGSRRPSGEKCVIENEFRPIGLETDPDGRN